MDRWETAEQVLGARRELETAIPGWRPPAAHGVGLVPSAAPGPAPEHFALLNTWEHRLPGVVVATVVGHVGGTASYLLSRAELERAVALLAPAEACDRWEHPNLRTWRDTYLPTLDHDPDAHVVAVFVDDQPVAGDDAAVDAFVAALGARTDA
ncbi:hypothetical protein [Cellulomonas gilvus]|uniref:Uncharacterized protein n=1 Tax=Cellulomonas gilvus (strain ATCC 13127 / NRRL B-14078) TaxID=593907 RepID=F8A696_CELGA|nr:hypothetical protein [Cellulomonas gilvus]AEI12252.1 hypothetical protein Celgi_1745 [Cellulomonas gilvus ATCC 13127]